MNQTRIWILVGIAISAVLLAVLFILWPRGLVTGNTLADGGAPQIAFLVFQAGRLSELYVYDDATRAYMQITRTNHRVRSAAWSPAGRYLVFHHDPPDGDSPLYRYDVTNGELLRLTPQGFSGCSEPAWSPDGSRLVCYKPGNLPGDGEIFLVQADGSGLTSLTRGSTPSWSADGSSLIFIARHDQNDPYSQRDIASINVDTGTVTILAELDGIEDRPKWSPDGRTIAFLENHYGAWGGVEKQTLKLWDGDKVTIVNDDFSYRIFEFSPDGAMLRFAGCEYDIASAEAVCTSDLHAVYSPDGAQRAVVQRNEICILPLDMNEDCVRIPEGVVTLIGWRP